MIKMILKIRNLIQLPTCKDNSYKRQPISKELRKEVSDSQNEKCYLCECKPQRPLTHHIIPNGRSIKSNLVLLCPTCHKFVHVIIAKQLGYKSIMRGGY